MKIILVPSAFSADDSQRHYLTTFLVNDMVAVDAGCLGLWGLPQDQARIQHVFLTHSHIDHLATLPIFLENVYDAGGNAPTIHAGPEVMDSLQKDLFNGRLWPDFIAISRKIPPLLKLSPLNQGQPVHLNPLTITPVPVNHVVPTFGYIVDDGKAAVVVVGDTGPTQEIWDRANRLPHLKAVFLEATFPDSMSPLAETAKHLTPASFAGEIGKIKKNVPVIAVHLKARYYGQLVQELKALNLPNLEMARYGSAYMY